ncbi:MAG: hypothetical protein CBC24_03095 [Candidatus Pelagibacter sp. TMED64]|nr:hypothetical protein [Candidatus Pelagibacter sp.]OUU66493.1 MAG: hypothetical protein CBC24_03095 [Candidatus Pelagibacter sp. TMED64]|tara:strand:+ start:475 stop:909 length:435 start_codon:yes stop_codon:yes gene_type:complete
MPSVSKQQQKFFGVVKAMQKGDTPKKGKAGKAAKSMSKDDVDDFASTKHKGLPKKVKKEMKVRELIKKLVREIMTEEQITEALDAKKIKKELNNSLKGVRKNNFTLARELNKINKTKAKQVMVLYKRYIIEYQIRIEKILRDVK